MISPSILRLIDHANRLADPMIHSSHRLALLRLVISAAHDAHSEELNRLEEFKAVVVDEAFIPAGGIVE